MNLRINFLLLALLAIGTPSISICQEIEAETIVEGLNRPMEFALHPDDGTIFVAEYGANRITKVVDGKLVEVVTDFAPQSLIGMEAQGGPVALGFSSSNWLLVAPAIEKEKPLQVLGFNLSEMADDQPLSATAAQATLEIGPDEERLNGQIHRIFASGGSIYLAGRKPEKRGFVATIKKSDAAPDSIEMLMPKTLDAKKWVPPNTSLTVSTPEGYLAVVERSFRGSALAFYSDEGEEDGLFVTGLSKVSAIAYGPNRGRLFLADQETGAIYKLIESDNKERCKSVEVYKLANISDMQFNEEGELIVTTHGTDEVGDDTGKVIKLTGLDQKKSEEE